MYNDERASVGTKRASVRYCGALCSRVENGFPRRRVGTRKRRRVGTRKRWRVGTRKSFIVPPTAALILQYKHIYPQIASIHHGVLAFSRLALIRGLVVGGPILLVSSRRKPEPKF